jgi:hypothetical protein
MIRRSALSRLLRRSSARKAVGVVIVASLGTWVPTPVAASAVSTTPPPSPIAQYQSGRADGAASFSLTGKGQSDLGDYIANGQLGRGTYAFRLAYDDARCAHGSRTMTATGTSRLIRSDGAVLSGTVTASEDCLPGLPLEHAVFTVTLTRGSRDIVGAKFELAGTMVLRVAPDGEIGTESFGLAGVCSVATRIGYWMVDPTGNVFAFGGARRLANTLRVAVAHIESTPTGDGYWIVDTSGGVHGYGDARALGDAPRSALAPGEEITSLSATRSGLGYWMFTTRGRVLPFGDATFFGDLHGDALNGPIVGSAATPTGHGYFMVAADGGVFTFGDAKFRGSMGSSHLNQPVVGLVPTADNHGYWLVARDGGVFTFGDARFRGSMGGTRLNRPVIGMVRYGPGYLMVAGDGGSFDFSPLPFFGSLASTARFTPVVSAAAIG